ncbi:MAG: sensor histidine kinase [Myxococcota bacterium]
MSNPSHGRRDLWLPALVGLVGALASVAAWGLLVADRRERLLDATTAVADEVRVAIEDGLVRQVASLEGLAELWTEFGLRTPDEWEAQAALHVERIPGLSMLAWVDLDTSETRSVHADAADALPVDPAAARRFGEQAGVRGPRRDASGELFYPVYLPVRVRDAGDGVLVARLRPARFLDHLLNVHARGYALEVEWDGTPVFARGEPAADRWQAWWRVEEMVALPLGGTWKLVHRPTPEYAAARLTALPHYLLAAGLLLSLLLAVVSHQLRHTLRQSRFLAATNLSLERRGLELESRVADRTEALEEAVAELEAFNYSVSHDLRSPLGAILNFASILEEDYRDRPLDQEGLEILSRIRRSASRGTALLEDLLQLSRAGRSALAFESIDMAELVRETFAQARAAEGAAADEVELVVGDLPVAVADRALLGGVLDNLFSNALKYSRGVEKRRIEVTGDVNGDECVYQVADNGRGFDMRFVDKLFKVFERLHADEDVEGTGVGLALVARILRRHGGWVRAEGTPGRGACFRFGLPRRDAP